MQSSLEELEELTTTELKKINERIEFILSNREAPKIPKTEAYLFYSICKECLHKELKEPFTPKDKTGESILFLKKSHKKTFQLVLKTVLDLNDYLSILLNKASSIEEKRQFYCLYVELISQNILSYERIPLSLKTILTNYSVFPFLLNKAFPGYIKAGLMSMVINDK